MSLEENFETYLKENIFKTCLKKTFWRLFVETNKLSSRLGFYARQSSMAVPLDWNLPLVFFRSD